MSAKDKDRPKLQEMLDYVRDGDTVIIHDLSRLARNTKDLLERQREGIALAKAKGKYKGRKKIKIDNLDEYYEKYRIRMISKAEMARQLNISRPTLDKLLKEYEMNMKNNSEK